MSVSVMEPRPHERPHTCPHERPHAELVRSTVMPATVGTRRTTNVTTGRGVSRTTSRGAPGNDTARARVRVVRQQRRPARVPTPAHHAPRRVPTTPATVGTRTARRAESVCAVMAAASR